MGAAGEKVEVDPETFKVKDGKLFLFYHTFISNTLTKWNKDEAESAQKGGRQAGLSSSAPLPNSFHKNPQTRCQL